MIDQWTGSEAIRLAQAELSKKNQHDEQFTQPRPCSDEQVVAENGTRRNTGLVWEE